MLAVFMHVLYHMLWPTKIVFANQIESGLALQLTETQESSKKTTKESKQVKYSSSLRISRIVNSKEQSLQSRNEIFRSYVNEINSIDKSFSLARRGRIYQSIAIFFYDEHELELAIAFYKKAVNYYELSKVSTSDALAIEIFSDREIDAYRNLSRLLLNKNRILEAQRVLDLLRYQEIESFLQRTRGNEKTSSGIVLSQEESHLVRLILESDSDTNLSKILESDEFNILLASIRDLGVNSEVPGLENDSVQLENKNSVFLQVLMQDNSTEIILSFSNNIAVDSLFKISQIVNFENSLQVAIQIAHVLLNSRTSLSNHENIEGLPIVPDLPNFGTLRFVIEANSRNISDLVFDARKDLTSAVSEPRESLQKIYDLLIAPIRPVLDAAEIDTIIYSPDSILRYIPLAALHDGEQYLVENFAINHVTAVSLTDLNTSPSQDPNIVAGAFVNGQHTVTTIDGENYSYGGLPGTDTELQNIEALFGNNAVTFRDNAFSKSAIETRLDNANILHLATHAQFVPGIPFHSFVLFGNGEHVTFEDLRDWKLPNTELVVLSACETGIDSVSRGENGIEILGFSYLMQEAGADATLSSLWRVDDSATQQLMSAFYARLKSGESRAQALRQAQIAAIRNGTESDRDSQGRCAIDVCFDDDATIDSTTDHPYFWSPFILIGNGL